MSKGFAVKIVLTTPEGSIIEQFLSLGFWATSNKVEYEAVIGLKIVTTLGVVKLEVRCDSLLKVSQINREYAAKDDQMAAYLKIVSTICVGPSPNDNSENHQN